MCKRNSYFDNVIKAFLENWSSIFIILRFVPFFFLPQFWTGDSRIEWWDKFWLKNSTLLPNTWLPNKINVVYHCPESWVQGMECISSKFSVLNGKYFKKNPKRLVQEYSIILPGDSPELEQNQRSHLYTGTWGTGQGVCRLSFSLSFSPGLICVD